jgi:hypothetical protein
VRVIGKPAPALDWSRFAAANFSLRLSNGMFRLSENPPIQEHPALPAIAKRSEPQLMGAFVALRAFHSVQDFVALIDSWSNLLLASETHRVAEIADDAPILEMQLGVK